MKTTFVLRFEAAVLFILAIIAYEHINESWILFGVLLLLPDVSMIGYLKNSKLGAITYNIGHSYVLPLIALGIGYFGHRNTIIIYALIWVAHIAMDRALGYGLKEQNGFNHTHLGLIKK